MKRLGALILSTLVFSACGKKEPETPSLKDAARAVQSDRLLSMDGMLRGAQLFQQYCAQCHGPEAQGHPDWRNPKVVAAPPLNGTGDVWKRRKQDMIAVIKNGVQRNGEPVMPAWQGRLSDREIEDIISWYQALWPPEVYERWRKANASETVPSG